MLLENNCFPEDNRVLQEAETLVEAGYDVTVVSPNARSNRKLWDNVGKVGVYRYPAACEIDGLLGYSLEYGYSLSMLFLISLFVFVRRGFDAVHVHTPPDMTGVIAIFYQFLGKKFVFDLHDLSPELYQARRGDDKQNLLYRVLRYFERLACRRADRLIATNITQHHVQTERCGAEPHRCYVVRNGPKQDFLGDVQPNQDLLRPNRLILGYIGAIGIQDGVDEVVRVVHALTTLHNRTDFLAVIIGDGPALQGLKKLAKQLDVSELIQFMGKVPFASVPAYIAAFDICLTPDPSNAYNDSCTTIKTMEYMALRKPTVCFRTRENEFTAGDAALYADDNDVLAFAAQAVRLMDDPALRASMGQIARERIDRAFTWEHNASVLVELYRSLYPTSTVNLKSV